MLHDDSLERFERGIRIRRRLVWLGGAALLTGSVAAVAYQCRSSMRERPASAAEPVPAEVVAQMQAMQAALDHDDTIPAGFLDAVTTLDHSALADAPPCPRRPPGGARAYTVDEVVVAPTRVPHHRSQVIIVGQHQQAMAYSATQFHPGRVLGMAYLWDDDAGAIICAGEVNTSSSDGIDYTERGVDPGAKQRAADADLQGAVDRAVTSNLHQVLR